jgi:hypothetical protein
MAASDIAPSSNSDRRIEPGALSPSQARSAQLALLCACGRRLVELKVLGCCRLCYQRRYHSLRWFGGLRELIIRRDRFRCRVCGVSGRLVVHHRDERNARSWLITLRIGCHVRLHRSRRLRYWVPEVLLGLWRELHPDAALQLQLPFAVTTRATDETIGLVRDSKAAEPTRLPHWSQYRALLRYRAAQFN